MKILRFILYPALYLGLLCCSAKSNNPITIKNDQMRGTVYMDADQRQVSYRTMSAEITNNFKNPVTIQIYFSKQYAQSSIDLFSIPENMSVDAQLTPLKDSLSAELINISNKELKNPGMLEDVIKAGDTYTVRVGAFFKSSSSDSAGGPRMEFYIENNVKNVQFPAALKNTADKNLRSILILKLIWEEPFHPEKEVRIVNIPCGIIF